MATSNDSYNERDMIAFVAKQNRPADSIYNDMVEAFNRVAKQLELDPADASRFRKAFSSAVAKRNNEQTVSETWEAMHEFIINSLWHNHPVELRGLVAFRLFDREPRKSHNLHNGESFTVPSRQTARAVKLSDLKKITADLNEDGTVHREGDHPTVEARRERDQKKLERRRERERRERQMQKAREAERQVQKLERELEKKRELAAERRAIADQLAGTNRAVADQSSS